METISRTLLTFLLNALWQVPDCLGGRRPRLPPDAERTGPPPPRRVGRRPVRRVPVAGAERAHSAARHDRALPSREPDCATTPARRA